MHPINTAVTLSVLVVSLLSAGSPEIISYGPDPEQTMQYTPSANNGAASGLVVFVHGGGWSRGSKENATGRWKAAHFTEQGFAFASIDYRLVPRVRVEDQAADVASSLAKLFQESARLGFDTTKVVLMGPSAGAHLSALVGTDPSCLGSIGRELSSIAGVVLIDGAAYDVPRQMRDAGRFMASRYEQAFGRDTARQRNLSPVLHAQKPNASRFLILHIDRADGTTQARDLAQALVLGGTSAQINGFSDRGLLGHMRINRGLGDPKNPATAVVDQWLGQIRTAAKNP